MIKKMFVIALATALILPVLTLNAQEKTPEVPKKALRLLKKANSFLEAKEFDKAIEKYNEAIKVAPDYAPAHLGVAKAYMNLKKSTEALDHLNKAIAAKHKDTATIKELAGILNQLAQNFASQKKFKEANVFYQKLALLPHLVEIDKAMLAQAYYNLGANYLQFRDTEKSNHFLLKILDIPGIETENQQMVITVTYFIGLNFSKLEESEKSNQYLLKFMDMVKDNPAHQWIGPANFFIGSNNFNLLNREIAQFKKDQVKEIAAAAKARTDVLPYLEKVIANEKANPLYKEQALMKIGNYQYLCHELDQAISTYETLIEKFPNSPDMAKYKEFLGKIKEAKTKKEKDSK